MITIKTILVGAALIAGFASLTDSARADHPRWGFSVGVSSGGYGGYCAPRPPVYYAPPVYQPPVYYSPPVYAPPPVYCPPVYRPPVVYQPPVYYSPPVYHYPRYQRSESFYFGFGYRN